MDVLNHGYVRMSDVMGDDEKIIRKARQTHNKHDEPIEDGDYKLINHMMKNGHGTPFEVVVFTFDIKCPIFVARELMRHRIGSFNEMSGRYVKLPCEFYTPELADVRTQTGKPIDYENNPMGINIAYLVRDSIEAVYETAWSEYNSMLNLGVAKEVARVVLPVGIYTRLSWTVNLRSLFNFIKLRSHKTALLEIRRYSQAIEQLVMPVVPVAYQAFIDNGRVAP